MSKLAWLIDLMVGIRIPLVVIPSPIIAVATVIVPIASVVVPSAIVAMVPWIIARTVVCHRSAVTVIVRGGNKKRASDTDADNYACLSLADKAQDSHHRADQKYSFHALKHKRLSGR